VGLYSSQLTIIGPIRQRSRTQCPAALFLNATCIAIQQTFGVYRSRNTLTPSGCDFLRSETFAPVYYRLLLRFAPLTEQYGNDLIDQASTMSLGLVSAGKSPEAFLFSMSATVEARRKLTWRSEQNARVALPFRNEVSHHFAEETVELGDKADASFPGWLARLWLLSLQLPDEPFGNVAITSAALEGLHLYRVGVPTLARFATASIVSSRAEVSCKSS
jgi:hypothetical protein